MSIEAEAAVHPAQEEEQEVALSVEAPPLPTEPAQNATVAKMFKYSQFIDVGEGADECEHSRDGACEDPEHFHAWCRLPNPIQQEAIRKKGAAAKARLVRRYTDRDSDESVVLDSELAAMADPVFVGGLIDELLAAQFTTDYIEADQNVREMERFEHYPEDRAEYARLEETEGQKPVDEQSAEYKDLADNSTAFIETLREEVEKIQGPKREEFKSRSVDEIVELVRNKRIEGFADNEFLDVFNTWVWLVGTFRVDIHDALRRPTKQMWERLGVADLPEAGTMFAESPEVVNELRQTYGELQVSLQRASSGN